MTNIYELFPREINQKQTTQSSPKKEYLEDLHKVLVKTRHIRRLLKKTTVINAGAPLSGFKNDQVIAEQRLQYSLKHFSPGELLGRLQAMAETLQKIINIQLGWRKNKFAQKLKKETFELTQMSIELSQKIIEAMNQKGDDFFAEEYAVMYEAGNPPFLNAADCVTAIIICGNLLKNDHDINQIK